MCLLEIDCLYNTYILNVAQYCIKNVRTCCTLAVADWLGCRPDTNWSRYFLLYYLVLTNEYVLKCVIIFLHKNQNTELKIQIK